MSAVRTDATGRRRLLAAVIVAFVALQVAVPTLMLFQERAARFGWQMFSGARSDAEFVLVDRLGVERKVEVGDYVGKQRAEIDFEAVLPPYLCEREPDAVLVRMLTPDGRGEKEEPCGR